LRTAKGAGVEYILAVPARRYADFGERVAGMRFAAGVGEATWEGRRLVGAHDPARATEQGAKRRRLIEGIEAEGERMAQRLDAADDGKPLRVRKSTDRRAYLRFCEQVKEAGLSRILKADLEADRFSFHRDEAALAHAEQLDGKLLLVTNAELKADDVVARYKALADIERGFRVLKSDIEIAPVHHRLPERIRAHALICFLALVLHRVMRMRLKAAGSNQSPTAVLRILQTIQRHQVRVGNETLRGINAPTLAQRELFSALGTQNPPTHERCATDATSRLSGSSTYVVSCGTWEHRRPPCGEAESRHEERIRRRATHGPAGLARSPPAESPSPSPARPRGRA